MEFILAISNLVEYIIVFHQALGVGQQEVSVLIKPILSFKSDFPQVNQVNAASHQDTNTHDSDGHLDTDLLWATKLSGPSKLHLSRVGLSVEDGVEGELGHGTLA